MREWLTRRVATPMWVLVVLGCVAFGGVVSAAQGAGNSDTTTQQTQTTTHTSTQATHTTTPAKPTPTSKPKQWTVVNTFNGNGISKTAPFTVNASQWKIVWSCNPAAYGSEYNLMADLTPPGQDFGDTVVNVICKVGDASSIAGETMEYHSGTFYLDVNSEASWTFKVEVFK